MGIEKVADHPHTRGKEISAKREGIHEERVPAKNGDPETITGLKFGDLRSLKGRNLHGDRIWEVDLSRKLNHLCRVR